MKKLLLLLAGIATGLGLQANYDFSWISEAAQTKIIFDELMHSKNIVTILYNYGKRTLRNNLWFLDSGYMPSNLTKESIFFTKALNKIGANPERYEITKSGWGWGAESEFQHCAQNMINQCFQISIKDCLLKAPYLQLLKLKEICSKNYPISILQWITSQYR